MLANSCWISYTYYWSRVLYKGEGEKLCEMSPYHILQLVVTIVVLVGSAQGLEVVYGSCQDKCNTDQLSCNTGAVQLSEQYLCFRESISCKTLCKVTEVTQQKHHHHHKSLTKKNKMLLKRFKKLKKFIFNKSKLF